MKHRAISAKTTNSNDPFTDSLPKVWHTVTVEIFYSVAEEDDHNGEEQIDVKHYSADPLTAIQEVNDMSTQSVLGMRRVD